MCVRNQWTTDLEIPHVKHSSLQIVLNKYFFKIPLEAKLASNLRITQKLTNLTVFSFRFTIQPYQSNLRCHKGQRCQDLRQTGWARAEPFTPGGTLSRRLLEMAPMSLMRLWLKNTPKKGEELIKIKDKSLGRTLQIVWSWSWFFSCDEHVTRNCWGKFMIDCLVVLSKQLRNRGTHMGQNRHLVSKYNSNILNCFFNHRFHTLKVTTIYLHQKNKKDQKANGKKKKRVVTNSKTKQGLESWFPWRRLFVTGYIVITTFW